MDTKGSVSVICEYNPFHFGHKFQMERLKDRFDGVVCILSGDIVQRGTAAIASKYLRAEAALRNGANLVLELPIPWCCSSAKDFAAAGVHIAENIGTEHLAFGAEDETEMLLEINDFVSQESFSELIENVVKDSKNISYPLALNKIIKEHFGEKYGKAIEKPNNILALEYLSAMKGKSVSPFVIKRNPDHASSSAIRSLNDGERILESLPEESKKVFLSQLGLDFPRKTEKLDAFIISTLRRMNYKGKPAEVYSAPDDLVNKIIAASKYCDSFESLVSVCTDKVYTSARVRRAVVSVVFGITTEKVKMLPAYTTVLAADEVGRGILKKAKKTSKIDIITKPAKALTLCGETRKAYLFSKEIEDVVGLTAPKPVGADMGKTPIII